MRRSSMGRVRNWEITPWVGSSRADGGCRWRKRSRRPSWPGLSARGRPGLPWTGCRPRERGPGRSVRGPSRRPGRRLSGWPSTRTVSRPTGRDDRRYCHSARESRGQPRGDSSRSRPCPLVARITPDPIALPPRLPCRRSARSARWPAWRAGGAAGAPGSSRGRGEARIRGGPW